MVILGICSRQLSEDKLGAELNVSAVVATYRMERMDSR